MATGRKKRKKGKAKHRPGPKQGMPTEAGNKARFDQLLDDAIFGVKPKDRRG